MKVIKNINNNVALCQDADGKELVAFGKGIGFTKAPYEISVSQIERTYYNVDSVYISMINDFPKEVIMLADDIVNYSRNKISYPLSSNIVFTLADHINFSIQRFKKDIKLNLPIMHDVKKLFETEMEIGNYGLALIRDTMHVNLPDEEAAYIALHIINAKFANGTAEETGQRIIQETTKILEEDFGLKIDKEGFNYSRFVSHMNYLIQRCKKKEILDTDYALLYQSLTKDYPVSYGAAEKISKYLEQKLDVKMTQEEKLYLILHINRLCVREDCYL